MLSYIAKVDPGAAPHFIHKDDDGHFVFRDTREGAHEFESYAQASHVAHEKGGYPVHVALFGDAELGELEDEHDVLEAAGVSATQDEDAHEGLDVNDGQPAQAPAGAPTSVHDTSPPETKPEEPPAAT